MPSDSVGIAHRFGASTGGRCPPDSTPSCHVQQGIREGSSRMINTSIMRLLGAPVEIRARRLARAFLAQTRRAADVQRELLLGRVARHADSQFGRDHHFGEIRTPDDFRRRVPIGGYERHEPYIDRVRQGDLNALFGPGTEVLMFAHDLRHDQPAQDDPGDPRVAARLSRGVDHLGHPGLRCAHRDPPPRPPSDPPARQRLARVGHARGHPLRRDHRADRPHAEPPGAHDLLHAGRRLADQGHRVEVLRRAAVLLLSRRGHGDRRQSQHDPGHGPAGRPREGRADPRPRRRHDRRPLGDPRRGPPRAAAPDLDPPPTRRSPAGARSPSGPAGSCPGTTGPTSTSCPTGWAAR